MKKKPTTAESLPEMPLNLVDGVQLFKRGDGTVLCVSATGRARIILQEKEAEWVEGCRGNNLTHLLMLSYQKHNHVSFGGMVGVVRRLAAQKMLENHEHITAVIGVDKEKRSFRRKYFEIDLIQKRGKKIRVNSDQANTAGSTPINQKRTLFGFLCLISITVALWTVRPSFEAVLLPGGDPFLGLVASYFTASSLVTMRYAALAAVGYFFGGARYPWRLRLYAGILALDTGSLSIDHCHRRVRMYGWLLALCLPLLVIAMIFFLETWAFQDKFLLRELTLLVGCVGWMFLLFEMCPYLPTSAGRLYQTAGERTKPSNQGLDYLRQKMLRRTFLGEFFEGERVLLLWASLAFFWSTLAFIGAFELNQKNIVPLMIVIAGASSLRAWSVVALTLFLTSLIIAVSVGFLVLVGSFLWGASGIVFGPRRVRSADPMLGEDVKRLLKEAPIFSDCTEEEMGNLQTQLDAVGFSKGTKIITQGESGDSFYILAEGQADVIVEDESGQESIVGRVGPGDTFGEQALLSDVPRTASVVGTSEGTALVLSRLDFEEVVKEKSAVTIRNLVQGASLLHNAVFFQDLEPDVIEQLLHELTQEEFGAGEKVFSQGDEGHHLYIVMEGEFWVLGESEERPIAILGPGDPFGEIAILANVPRTATVRAQRKSRVLRLEREIFYSFFTKHLALGLRLEDLAAIRVKDGNLQ